MSVISIKDWNLNTFEKDKEFFTYCFNKISGKPKELTKDEFTGLLQEKGIAALDGLENKVVELENRNAGPICQLFYKRLKKEWKGPEVPIYLFPARDALRQSGDGLNGVSFEALILLFIHPDFQVKKLQALILHEYNHICRLHFQPISESEATLLTTVLLEGMAEFAVLENLGEEWTASWTSWYDHHSLEKLYLQFIKGREDWPKLKEGTKSIMFGGNGIPSMMGYYIGYQIIKSYAELNNTHTKELYQVPIKNFQDYLLEKFPIE